MKKTIIFVILSFLALFVPKVVFAEEKINKFGIHILEPSDLPKAQELVNSSGGDWGWVTVVIRDDDMNFDKWQGFMDECRIRHLIPLVRIATHLQGANWVKPKTDDAQKWAIFLNKLNWPVSDQYVVVYNEPNHAKEWGGEVNPREYARIFSDFSSKFNPPAGGQSSKFMILNAGLDLAAPNGKETMEAFRFMEEMNFEAPGIFETIDGWSSHSYPNHGYLGKPWDTGKHSVKGYENELYFLKNTLKVQKNLPVFITETGWPHEVSSIKYQVSKTGKKIKVSSKYYNLSLVAEYVKYVFENIWLKDERVKAVTPFVLNYPGELFADFSWLDKDGNSYPQYGTIKAIIKPSWWPVQETKYEFVFLPLPPFLPANTKYNSKVALKNIGQSIWGENGQLIFKGMSENGLSVSDIVVPSGTNIFPGQKFETDFSLASSSISGEITFGWEGTLEKYKVKVFPPSIINKASYTLWQKVVLKIEAIFR